MSNAYKCDRCGKYGDGNPEAIFKFPNPFDQGLTDTDKRIIRLCGDCQESLAEFIDGCGLSRETDCRTEHLGVLNLATQKVEFVQEEPYEPPENPPSWKLYSDKVRLYEIEQPKDTVLKEMRELGGRNY